MNIDYKLIGERIKRARKTKGLTQEALAEKLREATGLEVILVDERCSTMEAYQYLNATDTRGKKRRDSVDTLSAQIILQDYLDMLKNRTI